MFAFTCKLGLAERMNCVQNTLSAVVVFQVTLINYLFHFIVINCGFYSLLICYFLFSKMTFQFNIWDKFRELSNLPSSTFNNLVQLVTCFLQRKCLSLSILKVRDMLCESGSFPCVTFTVCVVVNVCFSALGN